MAEFIYFGKLFFLPILRIKIEKYTKIKKKNRKMKKNKKNTSEFIKLKVKRRDVHLFDVCQIIEED